MEIEINNAKKITEDELEGDQPKEITTDQLAEIEELIDEYQEEYRKLMVFSPHPSFPPLKGNLLKILERIALKFKEFGIEADNSSYEYCFTVFGEYIYTHMSSRNWYSDYIVPS